MSPEKIPLTKKEFSIVMNKILYEIFVAVLILFFVLLFTNRWLEGFVSSRFLWFLFLCLFVTGPFAVPAKLLYSKKHYE